MISYFKNKKMHKKMGLFAALFAVAGIANYVSAQASASATISANALTPITITLPGTPTTLTGGANTMMSNSYASVPSDTGTLLPGSQTLAVGSTLTIGASQPAGLYVSATPFTVTVNYN